MAFKFPDWLNVALICFASSISLDDFRYDSTSAGLFSQETDTADTIHMQSTHNMICLFRTGKSLACD